MGGRTKELLVVLRRNSPTTPWGFSLVGGADVNAPLIVTKVGFGSPADGVLQRGDVISKVGNYDARDIRHQDAQGLFRNAGNEVKVVVHRENAPRINASTGSSLPSSRNYSPLSVSPHLSPRGGNIASPPSYSPGGSALTPYYTAPFTHLDDNYFDVYDQGRGSGRGSANLDVHVTKQVATSVLERINANDPNKQIVHKQFNSPIGLYSDAAVADTIQKQTGISTLKRPVKYNPEESETYKALKEEELGGKVQEVTVPPQSKVYTPNKTIPPKTYNKQNSQTSQPAYANSLDREPEVIHQSNSFKRLMWSVLNESSY